LPIQILNGSDTILTTIRNTPVKIAAIAAKTPSIAAEIPATIATMTDPITVIIAVINPPPVSRKKNLKYLQRRV